MRTLLLTTLLLSISLSLSAQNCDSIFVEYFLLLYKERENAILLRLGYGLKNPPRYSGSPQARQREIAYKVTDARAEWIVE